MSCRRVSGGGCCCWCSVVVVAKVPLKEGKGKSHLTEHTDPLEHSCKKEEQSPAGRELSGVSAGG